MLTRNMLWPVLLVVAANTFYNICTKSTPAGANAFLSLTVTYLVAAVCAFGLYLCSGPASLAAEVRNLNWTAVALGVVVVALEFGYICIYRAGWPVNRASVTNNICLAVVLVFVGALLYREGITVRQIAGMIAYAAGLFLISK